jgi:hypothetical protein
MAASSGPCNLPELLLRTCIAESRSRGQLWIEFVKAIEAKRMAEIGVYRGEFATELLTHCPGLTKYYMIDPWQHLENWNKPANREDSVLEQFFRETMAKTDFAAGKRVILRGRTTEVIDQISDGELDFAYIDADHTLKGIAIDLIRVYPKVRAGGFLGGDDFTRSAWQHETRFEPTLVFPFAVYFAEAVGATIYALPYSQFCLRKDSVAHFAFVDFTGGYDDVGLRNQFSLETLLRIRLRERFPRLIQLARKTRDLLLR